MGQLRINTVIFLSLVFVLASCSNFQKLLKSDNVSLKYEEAKKLFNEEEYQKAVLLLEDIIPFYRATRENEKVSYMYAYCQFGLGNYLVSASRFKNLYDLYPYGAYAEDALFYYAYCTYKESPPIELDQSSSFTAIEALQYFINKFPKSDKVADCNGYIDDLLDKIEEKDIRTAKLFYQIEDYKAAVWTLKRTINEYPVSEHQNELKYLLLSSYYKLAQNSVEQKKKQRYEDVIMFYEENKSEFEQMKESASAYSMYKNAINQVNKKI